MKKLIGKVVAEGKQEKTAIISVERYIMHRIYKKRSKRNKRYQVSNPLNAKIGDVVSFTEGRPISKMKHWSVTGILGKNKAISKKKFRKGTKK